MRYILGSWSCAILICCFSVQTLTKSVCSHISC